MAHPTDPTELAPVSPELFVPDVAAAVRFYTEILGFESHRVDPDFAIVGIGQAIIMFADQRMYGAMGGGAAGADRGLFIDTRIMVPDVDVYHQRCVDAALEIIHPSPTVPTACATSSSRPQRFPVAFRRCARIA